MKRRGEVGEHTVNDYIIARRAQLRDKSAEFLSGDKANAVQPRIYFNMNMRGPIHGPVFWGGTHYGHSAIHPYFL